MSKQKATELEGPPSFIYSSLSSALKKPIFKRLANLKHGILEIRDGSRAHKFGSEAYPLRASLTVNDPSFYFDLATKGSLGAAQAYILRKWDTQNLDDVISIFAANRSLLTSMDSGLVNLVKPGRFFSYWKQRNTLKGAKNNIVAHYDLPDELFRLFLDETAMYSSAIFESDDDTLFQAQKRKLEVIAQKLDIRPHMKILEIGTGWGGLALFLAQNYDCHVTTTTISENQHAHMQKEVKKHGLEDKITLLKKDYRLLDGKYDRLVSIEMIEAVGREFLGVYLEKIGSLLKEDGMALLQAITIPDQEYERAVKEMDFIKKYIFPGSFIPSIHAILSAAKDKTDLRTIAQEDFADSYAKTLRSWKANFQANRAKLADLGLDAQFERMWNFYFSYCIGGFRERAIGVSHIRLAKPMYKNI